MKSLVLCLALTASFAHAQTCTGRSPTHTVALVELYTSEGCSSCPPADRYISDLRAAGIGPAQAVPLSLHVDYWNAIGWKDPFSGAVFTERQRALSDHSHTRTIYTPEFFVGGRELRNWSGGLPDAVKRINAKPAQASIAVTLGRATTAGLPVEVAANGPNGALLHVALVHNKVASRITAGENGGRTLHYDYVVRQWLAPMPIGRAGRVRMARALALPSGAPVADLAVTAFVQAAQGEVLQAFSLPVCDSPAK